MKVLIVDDHVLFAEALLPMLQRHGMEVTDIATTGEEGLRLAFEENPDLILLDLRLPDAEGIDIGTKILERMPQTRVLAVTALIDGKLVNRAMRAGFHGYLTKDIPMADFMEALDLALGGQVVMPRRLSSAAAGHESEEEKSARLLADQLTDREREILALLVEGLPGEAIAERISISPNTVRTHIHNVLMKLQVHSRLEAAAFAVRFGVVASLDTAF